MSIVSQSQWRQRSVVSTISTVPVFVNTMTENLDHNEGSKEDLWHRRYGHISVKNLQKLAREHLVEEYDYSEMNEIKFCEHV